MRGELGEYTRRAQGPHPDDVQHQCADRVPAGAARPVPRLAPAGQHRPRRALSATRSWPIAEGGGHRHRRRHGGTGRLETYPFRVDRFVLVLPHGHPLAATAEIAFADVLELRFRRPRPRQRAAAVSLGEGRAHRPTAQAARAAAQLRRGVPPGRRPASASASCPRPRPAGPPAPPRSPSSPLRIPGRCGSSPSASATLPPCRPPRGCSLSTCGRPESPIAAAAPRCRGRGSRPRRP